MLWRFAPRAYHHILSSWNCFDATYRKHLTTSFSSHSGSGASRRKKYFPKLRSVRCSNVYLAIALALDSSEDFYPPPKLSLSTPTTATDPPRTMIQEFMYLCTLKANQNGTEQWSQNWNVHNFSRSTLLSLHIFVAHRTYVAVHIRGFKLLQYARFSVDMVRHGPSDFTYSTTVLWQVSVHYAG